MARKKDPNRPKRAPTGDYKSGYCRAPEHGKIKMGEVRNRWGPKGKPKPTQPDPFENAAAIEVPATINGNTVMMPAEAAAWIRHMGLALNGDRHAFKRVVEERRSRKKPESPQEDDPAIIEKRKELSAKLVRLLEEEAARKKKTPPSDE